MKKLIVFIAAALSAVSLCASNPKREFRGAWIHIVGDQKMRTMTTEQIQSWFLETVDVLKETGCNAVIFQVRPQADAFFESDLEPWTRFMTGVQGQAPDPYWDPLQFMIDACHERGMELHAWLNPYRVTSNDKEGLCRNHLYYKNPSIFVKYGKQLYFDPAEPEARAHTVRVIADLVGRYDIDAVHFDDYFYPYPIEGQDFPDQESFRKYGLPQGYTQATKADWRRNNVEMLIKEISDTIRVIKPWIRFGISPFGIHRNKFQDPLGSDTNGLSNYDQLFADVPAWAEKGYIDYIVPQLYWKIGHKRADYETLIRWWNERNFRGQLYIGQSISTLEEPDLDNPKTTQLEKKMALVRNLENVDGNVWWPGWTIPQNACHVRDSLTARYQNTIALIPAYTDIDSVCPDPVVNLRLEGGKLCWDAPCTDDPMQEAAWYVVYRTPAGEPMNTDNPACIVAVTRKTSFDVEPGEYEYGVSSLDRCWNESSVNIIP